MGYQFVPGLARIPKVPAWTPPSGLWRGTGADEGLFAYRMQTDGWGRYVIVRRENFIPSLTVDGAKLRPSFLDVNGCIFWTGSWYVYWSVEWGWVCTGMAPGYEPVEEVRRNPETGKVTYDGDDFYVIESFPSAGGSPTTAQGRGRQRGKSTKSIGLAWPRWTSDMEFGEYQPADGETGARRMGLPRFRGSNGETFVRSLHKAADGHYTYGSIRWQMSRWVIGEYWSEAGWHEGDEPNPDAGSQRFAFTRKPGSEATGEDITVSFDAWVCGEERDTAYLGEATVWR